MVGTTPLEVVLSAQSWLGWSWRGRCGGGGKRGRLGLALVPQLCAPHGMWEVDLCGIAAAAAG